MPETGPDDETDYAEEIAASAEVHKEAWQKTLAEMEALADDYEDEGWDTLEIAASHTAPTNPDAGPTTRFGFVHVVPDNKAEPFKDAIETGGFPQYRVLRNEMQGRVFMVTELLDPEIETAILVASNFEVRHAAGLVKNALEEGEIYTHVQTLDKSQLGSFRHDDVEKFFPNPQRYTGYDVDFEGVLDDEEE